LEAETETVEPVIYEELMIDNLTNFSLAVLVKERKGKEREGKTGKHIPHTQRDLSPRRILIPIPRSGHHKRQARNNHNGLHEIAPLREGEGGIQRRREGKEIGEITVEMGQQGREVRAVGSGKR